MLKEVGDAKHAVGDSYKARPQRHLTLLESEMKKVYGVNTKTRRGGDKGLKGICKQYRKDLWQLDSDIRKQVKGE